MFKFPFFYHFEMKTFRYRVSRQSWHPATMTFIGLFALLMLTWSCSDKKSGLTSEDLVKSVEENLNDQILNMWYPRTRDDEYGGFLTNFAYDWKQDKDQPKFIVTQARHVWTTASIYEFYPDRKEYLDLADHGYQFLREHMWDQQYGGFYQLVDRNGEVLEKFDGQKKRAYGNAFGIYGLAAYYGVSKKDSVLDLAKKAFLWLDDHSRDPEYGGYFQHMQRDGSVIRREDVTQYQGSDQYVIGLKDYNSSIHLLEAFTELYKVWPDSLVRDRLQEMYHIIKDTMVTDEGYLQLYFFPNWQLFTDTDLAAFDPNETKAEVNFITFGHDVETAYLLLEAAEALGYPINDKLLEFTKKMVDHALDNGWDADKGGFFGEGKYMESKMVIIDSVKNWWSQAEGLNSLLIMDHYFPNDQHQYYEHFKKLWHYVDTYLIDHQHGGWYANGIDKKPDEVHSPKAQIWKGPYHTSRAMMNCIRQLKAREKSQN